MFKSIIMTFFTLLNFCVCASEFVVRDLGVELNSINSTNLHINENNQVAGLIFINRESTAHAFYWDEIDGPIISERDFKGSNIQAYIDKDGNLQTIALTTRSDKISIDSLKRLIITKKNNDIILDSGNSWKSLYKINGKDQILGYTIPLEIFKDGPTNNLAIYDIKNKTKTILNSKIPIHPVGFNNKTQIIGVANSNSDNLGFFWSEKTGFVLLNNFLPYCLNDRGAVVGKDQTNNNIYICKKLGTNEDLLGDKFNLTRDIYLDFNVDTTLITIEWIYDINNKYQMIGVGKTINHKLHLIHISRKK